MSEKLKLYKIRESSWGKPKEEKPAEAYVAAISMSDGLRIFEEHFGMVMDATVTLESIEFLLET